MTDCPPNRFADFASPLAVGLLDELRTCLLECQLVLESLFCEADLNFDELIAELNAVRVPARQAFGAASLLSQGADLAESWSSGSSRPKAVFARHAAAIRDGAMAMAPVEFMIETVERRLRQPPRGDAHHLYGPRAHCQAITANNGEPCSNSALYLGSGSYTSHCYAHSNRSERDRYRQFQQEQHDAVEQAWRQRHELMRTVGAEIAAEWMQRRSAGRRWLATLAEV